MEEVFHSSKLEQIVIQPIEKNHRLTITPNENKFEDINIISSNALDILAIYLKRQKIIYI